MNSKMTTNSQLSATELKSQKQGQQLEQKHNHRNGDHLEDYIGWGEWGKSYRK